MEEKQHAQTQVPDVKPSEHLEHSKPKQGSSKWIIITIAVLVLVLIGVAAYFLNKSAQNTLPKPVTPTSTLNPATTWKTYTNAKYNYSIEYPSDWSFREFPDTKDGAAFNPLDKPGYPDQSDSISISVGRTLGNYANSTLEEYAKTAGKEIQNYNKLASFKKVTIASGVGYETTWMVQPLAVMGRPPEAKESESLPITYFEIPGNKTSLIRVTLNRKEDLSTYEKMLISIKITASLTPIPTADETAVLKSVIKKYIALKHGGNESTLTITVSKIEGNYAQGGASDQGSGGMWFAAKEDGVWKLVWDGNGIIECSIFTLYPNFPTSMIPECYDEQKQDTVKR